jgi:hypothetical protein
VAMIGGAAVATSTGVVSLVAAGAATLAAPGTGSTVGAVDWSARVGSACTPATAGRSVGAARSSSMPSHSRTTTAMGTD